MGYFVYILTNERHTVLYTGFTNDIARRTYEHKHKLIKHSFTKKYNCTKLIYIEEYNSIEDAKLRERQLKRYRRQWKENLINTMNPKWRDLYEDL